MIHSVYSSKSSFKRVQFNKGLNVVIAERKEMSDKKKTTNSRGKSTLISIINFCLGSDAPRSGLCIEELSGWDFTIDITLLRHRVQVTREVDNPNKFFILGNTDSWPFKPEYDEASIDYEGVDERQIAHAIEQAAAKAKLYDFQYIMTINSDMVPYNDFNEGFNFDGYIKLRLSDEDESGSLLGIHF